MKQLKIPDEDKARYVKFWVKPSVWAQYGAICDEMRLTRGEVLEIMTRLMGKAEVLPVGQLVEDLLQGVLKRAK